jgi:Zn-dependent M28 family amino/carboxypeptidase
MGRDTYFPGANDNASGTSMLVTLAKYFKEHPSEYNLIFIAFAGEEAGLLGSKYYVEHPVKPLDRIHFLLNLDIMGSGEEGITVVNATLFDPAFQLLTQINNERNFLSQIKSRGPAANSDHYWFSQSGVPAFFIYTMGPNKNYHDVFDRYENLSFSAYDNIRDLLIQFIKAL